MSEGTEKRSASPRPRPCASCPYRREVPSGVWEGDEYAKLLAYDGDTATQSAAVFMCHQDDGAVCSGWLGHGNPANLLAVRLGVLQGTLDEACLDYSTTVPLFTSGAAAAEHGTRDLTDPGDAARDAVAKIVRKRGLDA